MAFFGGKVKSWLSLLPQGAASRDSDAANHFTT